MVTTQQQFKKTITWPSAAASTEKAAAAARPAAVPSALMAPSVPRGTRCSVVARYVVRPYAWTQSRLQGHDGSISCLLRESQPVIAEERVEENPEPC